MFQQVLSAVLFSGGGGGIGDFYRGVAQNPRDYLEPRKRTLCSCPKKEQNKTTKIGR